MGNENRLPKTVKDLAKWIISIFNPGIVETHEYMEDNFRIEVWVGMNCGFARELQKELESLLSKSFKDENGADFFHVGCEERGEGENVSVLVYLSRNEKNPEVK